MDENMTPEMENTDGTDEENIVYLTDEDGNEFPFEFLDIITYKDSDYAVFFPVNDGEEEDGEEDGVVILKAISNDDGSADFVSTDDDDALDAVFEIFMENIRRSFQLDDEQE